MCGRFHLIATSEQLIENFRLQRLPRYARSYNIPPGQKVLTVVQRADSSYKAAYLLREGDTLVVTRLDRLCRSINDLTRISEELKTTGISLVVIEQNIDTSTSTGRLLFNMLGCIGEFENEIRKERQMDGIRKSLESGVKFGRKSKLTDEQVVQLKLDKQEGVDIKTLQSTYGISRDSVYRLVRE